MFAEFILGLIQGIAEWIPISSEAMIILVAKNFFYTNFNMENLIKLALFLHLGTFFSALIYFWKDIKIYLKGLMHYKKQTIETKKIISFLFVTTLISGLLGILILKIFVNFANSFEFSGKLITLIIGLLLIITGIFLFLQKYNIGTRKEKDLNLFDSLLLGVIQGFTVLPGLSRSGTTISFLLFRKIDKTLALKLSFLMSLPIVLAGNIILNIDYFAFSLANLIALLTSFIIGLLTIHILIKFSEKVNFGIFVIVFGILSILTFFI
jgi:undecaprenyl-diphosphatase